MHDHASLHQQGWQGSMFNYCDQFNCETVEYMAHTAARAALAMTTRASPPRVIKCSCGAALSSVLEEVL